MIEESLLLLQAEVERRLAPAGALDFSHRSKVLQVVDALSRALAIAARVPLDTSWEPDDVEAESARAAYEEFLQALESVNSLLGPDLERRLRSATQFLVDGSRATRAGDASGLPVLRRRSAAAGSSEASGILPAVSSSTGVGEGGTPADNIRFGASAPRATAPGAEFVARFVAYAEGDTEKARALLREPPELDVGSALLKRGTIIDVALAGSQMQIEGRALEVQSFQWMGQPVALTFGVQAENQASGHSLLRFDILVDGVVLGKVRLEIEITAVGRQTSPQFSDGHAFARSAFASYSSLDRQRVLDRVAAIRIVASIRVFLDCLDLNPGEAWRRRLEREIDNCETFMLFWSDAAAQSKWVTWEYERAYERLGLERMQFHPLENRVRLPRLLRQIHMADPSMDVRLANSRMRLAEFTKGKRK